ncbi:MAG: carboxypeptidase regulatory-like domain-containing protein [Candidatus Rokubacteria bacterium]|nr:carboxypeptidase regulatory-like domain-containing protein [Candidatus Rokubacteria bacterium]MBI2494755.1 carboxypeptidase regulatory-like domain-containing protein [Candidatus Rokubacteria bacterium]MBI4255928.1 carboxypeptidase regulatory-like domain-containing protein [Candidatus Rokubacteria bacterium]
MDEAPAPASRGRHFKDGGFVLALLTLAVATGYGLLAPTDLRATTLARPLPEPRPGPVAELPPRPERAEPVLPALPARPRRTWSKSVTGQVLDAERQPVAGASVVAAGREWRTDAEGRFALETLPADAPLLVKMPGFEKVAVEPAPRPVAVVLKPRVVKAAYLTYFGVGDRGIRNRVLDLAARTELNAVVIDVKGDRGWILYRTEIPEALAAGAQGPGTLRDFDALMADLKGRGIYTIARIVTFKDNVLARARPELAVIDTRTGKPWMDNENLAWVDPFREEVWRYNLAIAREAVRRGFDEVQFDYVRFPTDGRLGLARYAKPNNRDTRLPAIAGFLERARSELAPLGAFVAADVFGYVAFNENDTDIGQRVEELTPHLDYVSPMVYPSGYHRGIPGYRNPVEHPYQVVYESVRLIRKRAAHTGVRVRPWLQDFRDYAFDRRLFGVPEIRAQIKGAADGGAVGWMLWNPRNDYTAAALRQKEALAAR